MVSYKLTDEGGEVSRTLFLKHDRSNLSGRPMKIHYPGWARLITLHIGDVTIIEPGEAHTFLESSLGYLHFVIHVSSIGDEKIRGEKTPTSREQLGLQ